MISSPGDAGHSSHLEVKYKPCIAARQAVRGRGQTGEVDLRLEEIVQQAAVQSGAEPVSGAEVGVRGDEVEEDMGLGGEGGGSSGRWNIAGQDKDIKCRETYLGKPERNVGLMPGLSRGIKGEK